MATASETGWPYLQHRGGPKGFLKVPDAGALAFADFRGNRLRLKLLSRAHVIEAPDDPRLMESLRDPGHRARVARGVVIRVKAFDWNCPQHITARFSEPELEALIEPMRARIRELAEQLRSVGGSQSC